MLVAYRELLAFVPKVTRKSTRVLRTQLLSAYCRLLFIAHTAGNEGQDAVSTIVLEVFENSDVEFVKRIYDITAETLQRLPDQEVRSLHRHACVGER